MEIVYYVLLQPIGKLLTKFDARGVIVVSKIVVKGRVVRSSVISTAQLLLLVLIYRLWSTTSVIWVIHVYLMIYWTSPQQNQVIFSYIHWLFVSVACIGSLCSR